MSINLNDDYDKLAKILYPSIEASGNVYYGQTRKLTMDEVFDKYNGGFESHIESRRVEDSSADYGFRYEKYFCWKLGPLSGEFCIDGDGEHHVPLESYPLYYAKYLLNKTIVTEENILNSGVYNSYHYDMNAVLKKVFYHGGKNPESEDSWDGKNFYVINDGTNDYLYIAVINGTEDIEVLPEEYDPNNPLKLTMISGSPGSVRFFLQYNGILSSLTEDIDWYEYSLNDNSEWTSLIISRHTGQTDFVNLSIGNSIKIRIKDNVVKDTTLCVKIGILCSDTSGYSVIASGDIRSIQQYPNEVQDNEFVNLFSGCQGLVKAPQLPTKKLGISCYENMFKGCSYLVSAPKLPAEVLPASCYKSMFEDCVSLKVSPMLISHSLSNTHTDRLGTIYMQYSEMFKGCSSLKSVYCISCDTSDSHNNWLYDSHVTTIHTSKNSSWSTDDTNIVPSGCNVVYDFELEYTYDD